jgi:hypothetical protein
VARVAGVVTGRVVLLVAEMMGEFSVECALDQSFGQLLKQAILTKKVFRLPVVFGRFVEQFGSGRWHNLVLSRLNS